jgi:hypothetical protein
VPLFNRPDPLPDELVPAWRAFLDCAAVVEGGRRTLLGTMPVGRVEPTPVGLGVDAMATAIADARGWMDAWRLPELEEDWADCLAALDEAETSLPEVRAVAASTDELEELQEAAMDVVEPLDAFADAERAFRRAWRIPRELR